jgi:hypothetical protein
MARMAGRSDIAQLLQADGVWAFGGARSTPPEVQEVIAQLALKHRGPVVHGGAPGADRAATRLIEDPSLMSIYLNGPRDDRGPDPLRAGGRVFNAREMPGWGEALQLAQQFEDPQRPGGRTYNARNLLVLAGPRLESPRERLVVWTPGGQDVGGTGHAIRAARHFEIPVYNLGNPETMNRAMRWLQG